MEMLMDASGSLPGTKNWNCNARNNSGSEEIFEEEA